MENSSKAKIIKTIKILIIIVIIAVTTISIIQNIINVKEIESIEEREFNLLKKIQERNSAINKFIEKALETYGYTDLYSKPYIPQDFTYVEGEWNNGYVIKDNLGNQYVWVPCVLYDNENVTKLQRKDFDFNEANVLRGFEGFKNELNETIETCYEGDINIEKFIDSVGKNGGFYIGRYETGKEEYMAVIKADTIPYTNVKYEEVQKIADNFYKGKDITCSLINGLAYDTTLSWLEKSYKNFAISTGSSGNKSAVIKNTGIFSVNNIFDLNGNAYEMTTEIVDENLIVLRGSMLFDYEAGCRTLISKDSTLDYIGFRMILYN